ncbi:MAG: histidine kinase [Oscillibacter sp.]|nr:histidine kinase [uncultured Oscillibacter sp.]MCI8970488.1 histidine kinase [Oscillibacter sp.]
MKAQIRKHFQDQEELWRLETLLQDAEYRALQSQVNPHFLFNVLGLAMEAALVGDAERTVDVLENISYMLHYSLTSVRENTWLADELKMVQAYLFLQQRRFGDRVAFSVSFPQEVPALRIPGMTLQPVVENAVKHGVEGMTDGGGVEVLLIQTAEAVELCVRDNGWGIPRERLEALNRGEPVQESGRSTGLGLANVRGRMMMFYGRPDLMRVESVEGEGTSVYLKYLMGEEDFHVPNPDCR